MEIVIAIIATAALLISVYSLQTGRANCDKIKEIDDKVRDNEKVLQLKNQYGLFTRKRNE
jgi:hypothetical protein